MPSCTDLDSLALQQTEGDSSEFLRAFDEEYETTEVLREETSRGVSC
jgi:hypothetical protein